MSKQVVLFASLGGTSEELAQKIATSLKIQSENLNQFDVSSFPNYSLIIFVVSTYGKGGPPSNCKEIWEAIEKYSTQLPNLKFAVYGVGSSGFEKTFLGFAKAIENKFKELGATQIGTLGVLDELEELSTDYDEWIKSVQI